MALTTLAQALDGGHWGDSAACSVGLAIETGSGTAELEQLLNIPATQEAVGESCVEKVACTGRIYDRDTIGGGIPETVAIPSESALFAESRADRHCAVLGADGGQSHEGIVRTAKRFENTEREHGIIHLGQQEPELIAELIEVAHDGHASFSSPGGGQAGGFRVFAVHVEEAGTLEPILLEIGRRELDARVAVGQDGAAASFILDEDIGEPALGSGDAQQAGVDLARAEIFLVKLGIMVGAGGADVAAAKSPASGGDNGGGDLAAEADFTGDGVGFAVARGEMFEAEDDVGGIFTDAGEIDERKGQGAKAYLKPRKKQKREAVKGSASYNSRPENILVNSFPRLR